MAMIIMTYFKTLTLKKNSKNGRKYQTFNHDYFISPSSSIREWPTFPQLYLNGELVGGADIILQLHQNGELVEELEKIGHHSALLDKS